MANFMRFDFQRGVWTNSTDGGITFSDAGWCLLSGLLSALPDAGVGDRLYFATDTGTLYYDNGTEWIAVGGAASSDADTLDGQDGSYYLARANHTGTQPPATISPQGSGSGLGADTLDGQHGSYYLARANHTGTQAPSTISPQGSGSGLDADKLDGKDSTDFGRKFGGAHVYRSAPQTISNATFTFISWTSKTYDTDSIWSSTYPQRLIVPSGVTRIRLSAGLRWPDKSGATSEYGTWFAKNKTTASDGTGIVGCEYSHWTRADTAGRCGYSLVTPVIPVAGGDFFGLVVYQNTGGALSLAAAWMAMELIQ